MGITWKYDQMITEMKTATYPVTGVNNVAIMQTLSYQWSKIT